VYCTSREYVQYFMHRALDIKKTKYFKGLMESEGTGLPHVRSHI
jgi:hypothetical protein